MTEATDEKKPAQGGLVVRLLDADMVIVARYGGDFCISTIGGRYSELPTCSEAVCADLAWIASLDAGQLGRAESISGTQGADAFAHLRAMLDAVGSSLFMLGEMPHTVEVPGLGRWTFAASPACAVQ